MAVDDDEYGVVRAVTAGRAGWWQLDDEVDTDSKPRSRWDVERLQWTVRRVSRRLDPLACVARPTVRLNRLADAGPRIRSTNEGERACGARMTGERGVVM
jgi:hypothetical protein